MLQNIKVDVIYYKTNTDFEMEFNLCGCCRMRLLTDKVSDRKTLVHSMARAVSRSRVIIVAGSLFGEEGIINLAAGAIGAKLTLADNKAFGISGEDKIEILNGSTPLVTPEGYFGGCIIESGPQTMILISDSKNVRKTIMQNLIHPYIEEVATSNVSASHNSPLVTDQTDSFAETASQDLPETEEPELLDFADSEYIPDEIVEDVDYLDADPSQSDEIHMNESFGAETEEDVDYLDADPSQSDEIHMNESFGAETEEDIDYLDADPSQSDEIHIADSLNMGDGEEASGMVIDFDDDSPDVYEEYEPTEEVELFSVTRPSHRELIEDEEKDEEYYQEDNNYIDDDMLDGGFRRTGGRKSLSLNLPILIMTIILLLVLAVLCYCIFYVPSKDGVSASVYIHEIFETLLG